MKFKCIEEMWAWILNFRVDWRDVSVNSERTLILNRSSSFPLSSLRSKQHWRRNLPHQIRIYLLKTFFPFKYKFSQRCETTDSELSTRLILDNVVNSPETPHSDSGRFKGFCLWNTKSINRSFYSIWDPQKITQYDSINQRFAIFS